MMKTMKTASTDTSQLGLQPWISPPRISLLLLLLLHQPCATNSLLREPTGYTSLSTPSSYSSASLLRKDGACPVVAMFPYTIGHGRWPTNAHTKLSFDWLASAWLAMEHFNSRDASVVSALQDIEQGDCGVYFPQPLVVDSAMEGPTAVSALWAATTASSSSSNNNNTTTRPCAVLGPMDPRAVEEVATITTALDVPHFFYFAELSRFWQHGIDGNTVGMVLSPNARAHIMLQWLSEQDPARDYLAVVHWGKDGSSDLADELKELGDEHDVVVQTYLRQGQRHLPRLIDQVYQSGISTVLLNFDNPKSLNGMANAFADRGMLTEDYLYIISPDALPTDYRLQDAYQPEVGSNLDKLLSNALVFDLLEPFRSNAQDDPFLQAWRTLDETFVRQINDANPLPIDHKAYWQAPPDHFRTTLPSNYASRIYDSIMLLGINACRMEREQRMEQPNSNETTTAIVDKEEMIRRMHNSSFQGASGAISPFPEDESYRTAATDIAMGLYQIQPQTTTTTTAINGTETTTNTRTYQPILAFAWKDEQWTPVEEVALQFAYSSDHLDEPPPPLLPHLVEHNYLSPHIRMVGFIIVAFTWVVALGAMMSIRKLQHQSDTITRAQPFFLHMVCVGSIITGSAILALSWDESYGATPRHLDAACMGSVWAFFVGHVTTFMALFSKLYRIDKVLQFRRNVVSVRQVLGPLGILMGLTLVLLILWTALDPWRWERTWVTRVPPETYGQCSSDHFWAFFGPLMGIVVVAEALTTFLAFRTSDVPEEFGDSRTALFAIYTHVQSWIFGVPVLAVLGDSSVDGTYMARVLLVWIFSISSVVVVVGPRIHGALFVGNQSDSNRIRVTGLDPRASALSPLERNRSSLTVGSGGRMRASASGASNGGSSNPEQKPMSASLRGSGKLDLPQPQQAKAEEMPDCYEQQA